MMPEVVVLMLVLEREDKRRTPTPLPQMNGAA
jgi:hypothetical protein